MWQGIQYLRWLGELLFSLYSAFVVVLWGDANGGPPFFLLHIVGDALLSLDRLFAKAFHGTIFSHSDFDPRLFFGKWLFLALVVFLCLTVLGRIARLRIFVVYVVGIGVVSGPLFSCKFPENEDLTEGNFIFTGDGHLLTGRWLQWLELAVVCCVLAYINRRRWTNVTLNVLVLLLHFGFWGLILFGAAWRDYSWQAALLLLLPFCVSVTWGSYVSLAAVSLAAKTPSGLSPSNG
jgi:hypothetical protein